MDNGNEKINNEYINDLLKYEQEIIKRNAAKEKNYRLTVFILSVILLASVLFSGFQTIYIFRLNSGLEGILSYTRNIKSNTASGTGVGTSTVRKTPDGDLPEPWFSLEDAASLSDPDKTRLSTVDIVKKVSPATVSLSIIGVDNNKEKRIGSGSGFIITSDGYIVTNRHVVVLADESVSTYYVTVILPDEEQPVRAEVIGSDSQTDIAVLKVKVDRELPCVTLGDSSTLQAGELAIAIGNAMGTLDDTVTAGVISAPSREITRNGNYMEIIQTDTAINPGNSGGPLINSFGEVIGITNSKIITTTSENLGFAIPVNSVKKVIESIINYGKVVNRPYLGVSVKFVSDTSYYGALGGAYAAELVKDGPAENAGIMLGDRIISVDGVEIRETGDIIKVRDSHKVGDVIDFVVERDGKEITLPLTVGDSADYQ